MATTLKEMKLGVGYPAQSNQQSDDTAGRMNASSNAAEAQSMKKRPRTEAKDIRSMDGRRARTPLLNVECGGYRWDSGTPSAMSPSTAASQPPQDSAFSRHDSLFSFGVSSARNAAELDSLLGNTSARLKPGATVLPLQASTLDKKSCKAHAVSLEQAKPRARVEVDIVLESDCCVEGGCMRGNIKLRVRKRQRKEAPVLLAEGKVRVIGFEGIPGLRSRHTFYQRAGSLSTITDGYSAIFETPPDTEGYSRPMEGIHVLPFAMSLPRDHDHGNAKGVLSLSSGISIRYIALISVKVKDSKSGKRSIAHFYRDCEVWPRLDPTVVLANAPRPVQASTAKSVSVIGGGGNKLKLTATLHRITWVAGQRCLVRIEIVNETKRSVKHVLLTLVRTTILFKPKPHLNPGRCSSLDPDACQTATTHKVVAETSLEPSHAVAKGHASAAGWWTGVSAGQDTQFSHYIAIPPDALSIPRSRLIEVEYSIRVTVSAGALASDVHVTLPIRIINFISVDPTPSEPLVSLNNSSYARPIPLSDADVARSNSCVDPQAPENALPLTREHLRLHAETTGAFLPSNLSVPSPPIRRTRPFYGTTRILLNTPRCEDSSQHSRNKSALGEKAAIDTTDESGDDCEEGVSPESLGDPNLCPSSALAHPAMKPEPQHTDDHSHRRSRKLGNYDPGDGAGSDEEVDFVVNTAQLDAGCFTDILHRPQLNGHEASSNVVHHRASHIKAESYERADNGLAEAVTRTHTAQSDDPEEGPARCIRKPSPESHIMSHPSSRIDRTPSKVLGPRYPPSSVRSACSPIKHVPEGAGHGRASMNQSHGDEPNFNAGTLEEDEDRSGDATPRLGFPISSSSDRPPHRGSIPASRSDDPPEGVSEPRDSHLQFSRQLPQPPQPPQTHICDIPASISALEALRMSHLSASRAAAAAAAMTGKTVKEDDAEVSTTKQQTSSHPTWAPGYRSLPATPTRVGVPAYPVTSPRVPRAVRNSRPAYGRARTLQPSYSSMAIPRRPTEGIDNFGRPECSIVKGCIAALEERVRRSQESGAAFV